MRFFTNIIHWFNDALEPYYENSGELTVPEKVEILNLDLESLKHRIEKLEDENLSLTNELYRLENSLDSRIDILAEKMGIQNV